MINTYATRTQQRTTAVVHRLERLKLRNAMSAEPHKREFYRIVEHAMATGFPFADAVRIVTLDREEAARKEHARRHGIQYRSATY